MPEGNSVGSRRATLPRAFEKRKKEKANRQQCREYLLIEGDYNF